MTGAPNRIDDYVVEQAIQFPVPPPRSPGDGKPELRWQQLVQYGVSHAVNDFFELPAGRRMPEQAAALAERRWTNRVSRFPSAARFEAVKRQTIGHLAFALGGMADREPILRFQQVRSAIPELGMELCVIFHLIAESPSGDSRGFSVSKFIVEDRPEMIEASRCMLTAACAAAFGRLPERIEFLAVLDGRRHVWRPDADSLRHAHDYLRLLPSFLSEYGAEETRPRGLIQ